jgi:hypothetical protein
MGLGDGLIALVLSNNLHLNGAEVTTFHPFLANLQEWFPHLPLRSFPLPDDLEGILEGFDHYFLIYEKTPWMQAVLGHCQTFYPKRTTVLNPIATANRDYPYWEEGRFDGTRSFVENLYRYCKDVLRFAVATKSNGIEIPNHVRSKRFMNRVIFHPTSSRPGKNWKEEKYCALAAKLQDKGFAASFILTEEERQGWELNALYCDRSSCVNLGWLRLRQIVPPRSPCYSAMVSLARTALLRFGFVSLSPNSHNLSGRSIDAPVFSGLSELAAFVCESGYMIGNDSGIGHLASCLGLPTVTICRNEQSVRFWRPAWAPGRIITPSKWIPNVKGLRLRDKHWKKWISVNKVFDEFLNLTKD